MSNVKVNTINDVNGGSNAVLYGVAAPANSMGFRNRIINGDMRIDQRNAGASVTQTTGNIYPVDRFYISGSVTSKFTAQQNAGSITPPTGFSDYLGMTSSSAYTVGASEAFQVLQRIEGLNTADFGWGTASAATVTLSFWVRSSLTGTFGGAVRNSAVNRSYPFTYAISAANTWEQKSLTIAGDTSGTWLTTNETGIIASFSLGAGSTFSGTAGAWAAANYASATGAVSVVGTSGATFYITGVQLEAGTVASPFERVNYTGQLAMCQRYWQQFISTTGLNNGPSVDIYTSNAVAAGTERNVTSLPVTMTGTPTVTKVGTWSVSNCAQPTIVALSPSSFRTSTVVTSAGAAAASIATNTGWTASAEL